MKYLVTGGAGFIGSHLSEMLVSLGRQVVAVDDALTVSLPRLETVEAKGLLLTPGLIDHHIHASPRGQLQQRLVRPGSGV